MHQLAFSNKGHFHFSVAEQIYIDTQPLVRSVLDGYNVCIFAYGQTGSGKTYTMVYQWYFFLATSCRPSLAYRLLGGLKS